MLSVFLLIRTTNCTKRNYNYNAGNIGSNCGCSIGKHVNFQVPHQDLAVKSSLTLTNACVALYKACPCGISDSHSPKGKEMEGREQLSSLLKNTEKTQEVVGINCLVICKT